MTTITAKSILASRHALDPSKRIDTLLLRYPRWIHAEGRTHRLLKLLEGFQIELATPSLMEDENLSRNASSSRAIPINRLIQDVLDDPAIPLFWGKNQKGMQADEECNERVNMRALLHILHEHHMSREEAWLFMRDLAIAGARAFSEAGYHKQLVNRLLEPFSHITVVATATQWSNFLALRDHDDAEPHIHMLAQAIRVALDEAVVQTLQPGMWHLPFVTGWENVLNVEDGKKLSVARCASTSYKTVDGFEMTLERAQDLWDKLYTMRPIHASPFEHQARADEAKVFNLSHGDLIDEWRHPDLGGNLGPGWVQLRKTLPGECL